VFSSKTTKVYAIRKMSKAEMPAQDEVSRSLIKYLLKMVVWMALKA
jgi:hypothetical protein